MSTFFFVLTLTAACALFAKVEIHIEGPHGWAATLPTWRIDNKWTKIFWDKKPLTGYHLYLNLFMLIMSHLPFGLGLATPRWHSEARIIAFFLLFWVVEDFLWFALNPAFGLKRFKPQYIWWHKQNWWWIAPSTYWTFTPIGIVLYWLSL